MHATIMRPVYVVVAGACIACISAWMKLMLASYQFYDHNTLWNMIATKTATLKTTIFKQISTDLKKKV